MRLRERITSWMISGAARELISARDGTSTNPYRVWVPILVIGHAFAVAGLVQANQPGKPQAIRAPALIGYIPPSDDVKPKELWLAGSWRPGEGWKVLGRRSIGDLRVEQWSGFGAPDGIQLVVRTRPEPLTEPDEPEVRFALTQPARAGVVTTAKGNIRPRTAKAVQGSLASLKRWTVELLKQNQIRNPAAPRITGAWRVDLDGNGVEEIVWTARSRDGWTTPYQDPGVPGHALVTDYALLALRTQRGKSSTLRALAVGGVAAAAPNYRLLCPLDLDGDGRLEVYAYASYFEDHRLLGYLFDGKDVRGILGTSLPVVK